MFPKFQPSSKESLPWLAEAAQHFGVPSPELLTMSLVKQKLTQAASRSSVSIRSLTDAEARTNAATLAKEVYKRLFEWIVRMINAAIDCNNKGGGKGATLGLGVLDIYGFEILEQNGFEQLCINFVNEKLHQYAIALTLKAEQEEYASEGIEWVDVPYTDNLPVVTLIERANGGLFNVLDEACTYKNATNERFAGALTAAFITSSNNSKRGGGGGGGGGGGIVTAPRLREDACFAIQHFAGQVECELVIGPQ